MKRLMMKSGLVGIALGIGFGYSAANPCASDFNSSQLRSLGRAEAHRIGPLNAESQGASANPTVPGDAYRLRAFGRAEAWRISAAEANGSATPADPGRIARLRALGRAEARYIGPVNCEEPSH